MPSVNWKIELILKGTKYCVLVATLADKINIIECNNNIFTNKDTKLYVPVVTPLLAKDLKGHFIVMNIRQKVKIKMPQMDINFRIKFCCSR